MDVPTEGVGRPGITPVACPQQTWQPTDPAFDALPGAKAFFGQYEGGIYRIEIPDRWNGELMLSAHGFTTNAGRADRSCVSASADSRTSDPARLRMGGVELSLQWLRAGHRVAGHHGADRSLHEIQRRPCAGARVSDRRIDGRSCDVVRDARIPDRVCRRPGDVPGRARSCSTTSQRSVPPLKSSRE